MSASALLRELTAQPHMDLDAAVSNLKGRHKTLPAFQLILGAPHHAQEPITANTLKDIFIVSAAEKLLEVSDLVKDANQTRKLRVLFVHLEMPGIWLPQLFARADLRLVKNVLAVQKTDFETLYRVMQAWSWDSHHDLIATAAVLDKDTLLVTNCALESFLVKFTDFSAFKKVPEEMRRHFEIDADGSYIHWPQPDIHLGINDFRYVCDLDFRRKCDTAKLAHNKNFGKTIADLRKEYGFTQANIAGVSERTMRDIESGSRPSMSTLEKLASAHGQSLNDYLESISAAMPLK